MTALEITLDTRRRVAAQHYVYDTAAGRRFVESDSATTRLPTSKAYFGSA